MSVESSIDLDSLDVGIDVIGVSTTFAGEQLRGVVAFEEEIPYSGTELSDRSTAELSADADDNECPSFSSSASESGSGSLDVAGTSCILREGWLANARAKALA